MSAATVRERFLRLPVGVRAVAQILAVILCATAGWVLVVKHQYSSPLNLVWMVAIPALIGAAANMRTTNRFVMAYFLVMLSFVTILTLVFVGVDPL